MGKPRRTNRKSRGGAKKRGRKLAIVESNDAETLTTEVGKELDDPSVVATTIECLPVKLMTLVVRQFDICYWKQLELVNRQFRVAVLAAWEDLRSISLPRLLGFHFEETVFFGMNQFAEQIKLTKFMQILAVRSPRVVELSGLSLISDQSSADAALHAVTGNLSELISLDLGRTSASTKALQSLIKLKNLRDLTVVGGLTDQTLITVASELGHRLTSLKLPNCREISDKSVVVVAENLHKLVHLDLEGSSITDKSLTALARYCRELQIVSLRRCWFINSPGAQVLINSCPKLEKLCLCETCVDIFRLNKYDRIWCYFESIGSLTESGVNISQDLRRDTVKPRGWRRR